VVDLGAVGNLAPRSSASTESAIGALGQDILVHAA